jgi:hypothetical protein
MHWIETIFHVDPDHGNGLFEALVFAAIGFLLVVRLTSRVGRRRPWSRTHSRRSG